MSDVTLDMAALRAIAKRGGPTVDQVRLHARLIVAKAQVTARVRTGHMVSMIKAVEYEDPDGFFIDVTTAARDPKGFPYGPMYELRDRDIRRAAGAAGRVSGLKSRKVQRGRGQ